VCTYRRTSKANADGLTISLAGADLHATAGDVHAP
jgi:hypothetical protein